MNFRPINCYICFGKMNFRPSSNYLGKKELTFMVYDKILPAILAA